MLWVWCRLAGVVDAFVAGAGGLSRLLVACVAVAVLVGLIWLAAPVALVVLVALLVFVGLVVLRGGGVGGVGCVGGCCDNQIESPATKPIAKINTSVSILPPTLYTSRKSLQHTMVKPGSSLCGLTPKVF